MTINEVTTAKERWLNEVNKIKVFDRKSQLDLADKFVEGKEKHGLSYKEIGEASGYSPSTVSTYISVASSTLEHRVDDPNHHLTFSIYKRAKRILSHFKKQGDEQYGIDKMREMLMEYRDACDRGVYHDEKGDEYFPSATQFTARVNVVIGKEKPQTSVRTAKSVDWKTVLQIHQLAGKDVPEAYMQAPDGTEFDVMITTIAKYPDDEVA